MWRIALILVVGCLGADGQTGITSVPVTPMTPSFTAADPDMGVPAAQSSTVGICFSRAFMRPWGLFVQPEGPALTDCGSIPASALAIKCTSASINGRLGSTSSYASLVPSSATAATLSVANRGLFRNEATVNLQFHFTCNRCKRATRASEGRLSLRYMAEVP